MNWKLILQLSLFGLAMGIATVFFISSAVEPFCWLAIFVVCAVAIARGAPGRPFLHGVAVGLVNSVWVTASHALLLDQYLARHAREAAMMRTMPLPDSPRLMMALTGPVIGLVSGIVLGVFAIVAARFVASDAARVRPAGSGAGAA
jgi:hypothetical protein